MVDHRFYQSGEVVDVEVLLLEERLVQYAACALARLSAQLLRIFE
ncbi:hypothetical protein ACGFJ7_08980 [Actinoplanes sp. NPDC048988]